MEFATMIDQVARRGVRIPVGSEGGPQAALVSLADLERLERWDRVEDAKRRLREIDQRAERERREKLEQHRRHRAAREEVSQRGVGAGVHAGWQSYPHADEDRAMLEKVSGIGPQRSAWLMSICGSVPAVLATPAAVLVDAWPGTLYGPPEAYLRRFVEWQRQLRLLWLEALEEIEPLPAESGKAMG